MSEPRHGCQTLPRLARVDSPFDQVIALGFRDGSTGGMLRCGSCGGEFKFSCIDIFGEDRDEAEIRFFGLSRLPEGSIVTFRSAMSRHQQQAGPLWVPLWAFPTDEGRDEIEGLVDRIYSAAGPVGLIIASSSGLVGEVTISASSILEEDDWIARLGSP